MNAINAPIALPKTYQIVKLGDWKTDPDFGKILTLTEEEYRRFVRANRWPKPIIEEEYEHR